MTDKENAVALEAAKKRADVLGEDDEPPPAMRRPTFDRPVRLVVVEHFSLSMLTFDEGAGVVVRVTQLSKMEASKLAYERRAEVANQLPERSMQLLEKELQLEAMPRIRLEPNMTFLCVEPLRWNDVRFYLVEAIADGDGVVG